MEQLTDELWVCVKRVFCCICEKLLMELPGNESLGFIPVVSDIVTPVGQDVNLVKNLQLGLFFCSQRE